MRSGSKSAKPAPSVRTRPRRSLYLSMGVCLTFVFLGLFSLTSILNGVTGEYTSYEPRIGQITMSVVQGDNVTGQLSYGNGAILETAVPRMGEDDKLDCTFTVPQKWLDQGQDQREVNFHGTVKDGIVSGVLQEGRYVLTVKLERNLVSSLYWQLKSHLPFMGNLN